MKDVIFSSICILLCTLLVFVLPTEQDAAIYDDTVRLHILAPSDSKDDQDLKLGVRDLVLNNYAEALAECRSSPEATDMISKLIPSIEADVFEYLSELGTSYSAKVTLGSEWYPTRCYKAFSLPSGYYDSLKIVIGEGLGDNWWCVMYPPLCLEASLGEEVELSDAERHLITDNGYNVKFKLLEVASLLFDKRK